MRRFVLAVACAALVVLPTSARQAPVPELPFESVPNPLTMPNDVHFGEIAGVAVNSKKHVFVFSRGNVTGAAYMAQASQLLEFDASRQVRPRDRQEQLRAVLRPRGPHRQAGQHLDRRQGLEHDRQVQPGGPRRLGVRPQGRVVAPRRAARLRLADRRAAEARRAAGDAAREQQPAQPGPGAPRQRLQPADRRGLGLAGQLLLLGRLRQLARRQGQRQGRVGGQLGIARQGPGRVRHAARHRRVAEGRGLRRRPRQPPHPGVHAGGQVHPRVHHRRAGRFSSAARSPTACRRPTPRPGRRPPARPMRCA